MYASNLPLLLLNILGAFNIVVGVAIIRHIGFLE